MSRFTDIVNRVTVTLFLIFSDICKGFCIYTMSVNNKYLLNLKTNEGPVWVKTHNIHDSQPIVVLITRENEEVIAPASSLLANSSLLTLQGPVGGGGAAPLPKKLNNSLTALANHVTLLDFS